MAIAVDIIILSYAKTKELRSVTEKCIESLLLSEDDNQIEINCLIIESFKNAEPYNFRNTKTIIPKEKFGFNKFVNIGLGQTHNEIVCIANNDLLFQKNWIRNIIQEMRKDESLKSACPICTLHHPPKGILPDTGNYYGYEIRKELVGWCIVLKREILEVIGEFDENLKFWYCDNDYSDTLQKHHIKHGLVSSSKVDHLESTTINTLDEKKQRELTYAEHCYYNYKWRHRSLARYYYNKLRYIFFGKFDY
jgi:GT2 family glycosyltransferase